MPQRIVSARTARTSSGTERWTGSATAKSVTGWGVLVLAAVAKQRGHEVAIVDAKGGGITLEEATESA